MCRKISENLMFQYLESVKPKDTVSIQPVWPGHARWWNINICFRLLRPFDLWYILIYNHCMICLIMTVRDKLLPCTYWTCTPSSRVVDRWVPHLGRTRTRKLSNLFHRLAQMPRVQAHSMEMEMETWDTLLWHREKFNGTFHAANILNSLWHD